MFAGLKKWWETTQRRRALKKELRSLFAEVMRGDRPRDFADIEAQGRRLARLAQMSERFADEYDPGWRERGVCHLDKVRGLGSVRNFLAHTVFPSGGELLD